MNIKKGRLMLSKNIDINLENMRKLIKDCDDIKERTMFLGKNSDVKASIFYIEVAVSNLTISESVIGKFICQMMDLPKDKQFEFLKNNALGITDVNELSTIDEAIMGIMTGDGVFFIDGYDKALKISSKGYPSAGVSSSENEKAIRGCKESFSDTLKSNTSLIRKRIRNTSLKVKERTLGNLTKTTVAVVYMETLTRPSVLSKINKLIDKLENNPNYISDSGIIEQLMETSPFSPFPQYQTTERPDTASMALMDGRIIVIVDNSPIVLILPTFYSSFFKTADDYFSRYLVSSLSRIIRYIAAFIAITLPAIYVAALLYNPEIIPQKLLYSLYEARLNVPFSITTEILLMELSFELLKEAGIRIPGPSNNTIGIVGGLIVGQAAVDAGLVSPIVVVIVALTALASFAIPSDEMANAFSFLKYLQIFMAYYLGIFGIIVGWLFIIVHLLRLNSFGFPYLMPGISKDIFENKTDNILRAPFSKIKNISIFKKNKET